MKSKEADLLATEDTSGKVKYDQYAVFAEQWHLDDLNCSKRIVSEVRFNRMEFIACMLIPVGLPEFITERCHVMIQITGRIFYCRYR